jgi:spermidine synthase
LREDVHGGVTTVTLVNGVYTLFTNGKFQGNTGWEMNAQRLFAHYPSLFVSRFERSLVIGVGTGTTVGTLAAYPWKRIDVVEISPAIVEAARGFFSSVNRGALDDPRVAMHHADGRNFMLVDDGHYDLVGMELSSIWFAGAASLYSREFYQLVGERLAEGGIFQQWVQLHHVYRRDFATVVHTLRSVFPHVALFYGGGQGILVASMKPLRASQERLRRLETLPAIASVMPEDRPLPELLGDVLAFDDELDRFLEESARVAGVPLDELVSTDQSLYLEYATPRGNVLPWSTRDALVSDIVRFRDEAAVAKLLVP